MNYLTVEQYQELLKKIPELKTDYDSKNLILLFKVIYEGALRVSEALQITPQDLDLERKQIILNNTKGGRRRCKCAKWQKSKLLSSDENCLKCAGMGKYRVREFAWITPETWSELIKIKTPGPIFPYTRQTVWNWCKRLGVLINVTMQHEEKLTTNLYPHALRHSRPIHLLNTNKFTINEIMGKLRHKSLEPTTTYVKVSNESIQAKEANL